MTATHFGIALLALAAIGIVQICRSARTQEWDEMSKRQREALMRERYELNPDLLERRP